MNNELVEPADDPSLRQIATQELRHWAPSCPSWLLDAVLSLADCSETAVPYESWLRRYAQQACYGIGESLERFPDDVDAALLRVLLRLPRDWMRENPSKPTRDEPIVLYEEVLRRLVPIWKREGNADDWSPVFLRIWPEFDVTGERIYGSTAAKLLFEMGQLRPELMIDTTRLKERRWGGPEELLSGPETLEFWIRLIGPMAMERATRLVDAQPPSDAGAVALATLMVLQRLPAYSHHKSDFTPAVIEFVRSLAKRLDDHRDDLLYLGAYWTGILTVDSNAPDILSDAERSEAAHSARKALGRLRRHATGTDLDDAHDPDFVIPNGNAVSVLARMEGLWPAMQAMVLLLRALKVQVVADNLALVTYADEPAAPANWSWIGHGFMSLLQVFARREQKRDPGLINLREAFARFCLDRLRTKRRPKGEPQSETIGNDDMVEPDPTWRTCYVRAVRELRANPENRGHHVLHWSLKNDPEESVRDAAKVAYGEMSKGSRIPGDMSPRRLVFAALWWLRQAHVIAVGGDIDAQGARRTRQREVRETHIQDQIQTQG